MDSSASIPRTIHYFSLYRSVFHACIIVERLSETSKYLSRINIIYTEQWRFYEINVLNMYEIQNGLVYTLFKWNMQNICNIENIQNKNTFSKLSNRETNFHIILQKCISRSARIYKACLYTISRNIHFVIFNWNNMADISKENFVPFVS